MRIFSVAKGFHKLTKDLLPDLSEKELDRLRALMLWKETKDLGLACRTFGFSRATMYRWEHRFNPKDLISLKERSRRPKELRSPLWSSTLVLAVKELRNQYPRWGKDKLIVLLKEGGYKTSTSTVGRIIAYLKKKGDLVEPKRRSISAKRKFKRPYAIRKPRDYEISKPGDLVQVDTLDIRPLPGIALKQFTARDIVSKWDVIEARTRATAKTGKEFVDALQERMPFKVKAIQVDGGSEFYADFETACKERDIKLFVLPPKSPKLNGCVERANRTHTEEFYEVNECSWTIPELNKELSEWENIYNCIRPHQSLGYRTPLQFLKEIGIINNNHPSYLSHM